VTKKEVDIDFSWDHEYEYNNRGFKHFSIPIEILEKIIKKVKEA
jgi:hypothetical protein